MARSLIDAPALPLNLKTKYWKAAEGYLQNLLAYKGHHRGYYQYHQNMQQKHTLHRIQGIFMDCC